MACQQFLHSVLPWPTHHFRTELFGQSFRHGCFIMETIRHVHPLALRTFRQMDISTRESFDLGNFRQGEFSAQGIFGTMDISARDISAPEHFSTWIFWLLAKQYGCFGIDILAPVLLSMCRNVPMPKCSCAKNSLCRKFLKMFPC